MLLEHRKAQYESQDDDSELSDVFTKTLEYCQTFSKYNSKETIKVVGQWVLGGLYISGHRVVFTLAFCHTARNFQDQKLH